MAKMTKTQKKRLIIALDSKAQKLWLSSLMSTPDYTKIMSICQKAQNKLK